MLDPDKHFLVREEIESLHCFFVGWFSGRIEKNKDLFAAEFLKRFDPTFQLIPPAGNLLGLDQLAGLLLSSHGANPEFRIAIRDVQVRQYDSGFVLATYQEWQRGALASTPANNARISSAIFRVDHGLKWFHVHETWLPREVMEAGPYDF
jgi:hypothetical protein